MAKTVIHTVKKGENLNKIARGYGLKSFKVIYDDPVNAKFRKTRGNPDLIVPGDQIIIPNFALTPDKRRSLKVLISTIEARIKRQQANKKSLQDTSRKMISEVRKIQGDFKRTSDGVDAAATVLTLLVSLAKITQVGLKTSKMTAQEVAKANKEVLKELGDMHMEAVEPALQAGAQSMTQSTSKTVAVLGVIADSFFNMSSPSFWGKTYIKARDEGLLKKIGTGKFGEGWEAWSKAVTWDPQKEFTNMTRDMDRQAKKLSAEIDRLIIEDQKLLAGLKKLAAR